MSKAAVAPTDHLDMLDQMAEAHSRINDDQAWIGTNQIVSLVVSAATKGDTPPSLATILDYGCGAGRIAVALADRFPNAKVVGVDITKGMIEQSQERLAQQSADVQEKVQFHLLSARSPTPNDLLSLGGQTDETKTGYDLAVMSLVLGHIAPKAAGAAVVQSVASTLKPGGKFALAEFLYIPQAGEAEGTTEEKSQAHHGIGHDHQHEHGHGHGHGHAHNHSGGGVEGKHHHDDNHNHHDHNHSSHGHDHSHHGGHVAFTEAEIRALFVHCGLQPDAEFTPFDFEWGDKELKCILAAGTKL